MIKARNISTAKTIQAAKYRNAANVAKSIAKVRIRNSANVLKIVFSQGGGAFAVDVPSSAYGGAANDSTVSVTTEVVTATITGGVGPCTYLWTRVDSGSVWTIISPTSASTAFRASSVPSGVLRTAIFKCTVTDSLSRTIVSIDVNASAENYGGLL